MLLESRHNEREIPPMVLYFKMKKKGMHDMQVPEDVKQPYPRELTDNKYSCIPSF